MNLQKYKLYNFNSAYKKVISQSRSVRKLGGYAKVGDHRDVVNDACIKLLSKYGEELYDKDQNDIVKLLMQSMKWCRLSKMRSKKDISSEYLTNYISEFVEFDEPAKNGWEGDLDLVIDSKLNKLDLLPLIVGGYNSKDYMDQDIFKSKRIALYQTQKQVDKYKKMLINDEQILKYELR